MTTKLFIISPLVADKAKLFSERSCKNTDLERCNDVPCFTAVKRIIKWVMLLYKPKSVEIVISIIDSFKLTRLDAEKLQYQNCCLLVNFLTF